MDGRQTSAARGNGQEDLKGTSLVREKVMRVLLTANYFPPYVGGQERFVHSLSRELSRKGIQVTVVTSNYPPGLKHEQVEGFEVYRHTCLGRPLRNPIVPGMIFRWWRCKDFDLIHAHNEHGFTTNVAALLSRYHDIPLVLSSHGRLVFDARISDGFQRIYWRTVGKWILTHAQRITVVTPSEKKRLVSELELDPAVIDLLPVGVDLAHWDALSQSNLEPFPGLQRLAGRKVILTAARLIKPKGIQYLIRAMPEVVKGCPQAVCLIAGAGDYEGQLRALTSQLELSHHVHFYGLLSDTELAQCYQAADVFVLPSLGEGQPVCIMEAWAFSKPVVATRIDGVVDYFEDVTVLVEAGQPQALAQAILGVLEDGGRAARLGAQGRSLMESAFSWDRIAQRMIDTYEQALAAHAANA